MSLAVREIALSLFLGIIPLALVKTFEGNEGVVSFVKSSVISDYLLSYFAFFFCIHIISCGIYRIWGWHASNASKMKIKKSIEFVAYIGDGFLGVYRLITGVLLAFPIIWKQAEPEALAAYQVFGLFLVGCAFQFGTIAIASTNEWAKALSVR